MVVSFMISFEFQSLLEESFNCQSEYVTCRIKALIRDRTQFVFALHLSRLARANTKPTSGPNLGFVYILKAVNLLLHKLITYCKYCIVHEEVYLYHLGKV